MAGVEVPLETREDEFELSLELSVGGSYGKSDGLKEMNERTTYAPDANDGVRGAPKSDFSCVVKGLFGENGCVFADSEMIQALGRQEACPKVDDKVQKLRGLNGGGLVEDKIILETRKFRFRVRDRRSREEELLPEGVKRKQARSDGNEVVRDLNFSFCSENKLQSRCLLPQVEYLPIGINEYASYSVVPSLEANGDKVKENKEENVFDSGYNSAKTEPGSWLKSEYQNIPPKGGSISDSGSQSSTLIISEANDTSSHIEPDQVIATPKQGVKASSMATPQLRSRLSKTSEGSITSSLTNQSTSPPSRGTNGLMKKPPKAPNRSNKGASAPYMPCVSTTGNGPNGKTVTGFLYKYTKDEVSIMCVCHGIPFSPAGFVKHAGGRDITNPLRQIRVVPFNLGT